MRSRLGNSWVSALGALSLAAWIANPALSAETDEETLGDKTIDELIVELEKRGVVTAPGAAEDAPAVSAEADDEQSELLKELLAWFDRIDLYGDFRARLVEGFVYDNDTNDELFADDRSSDPTRDPKDRYRLRYRLRFGVKADINEYIDTAFRLATGPDANSGNQTLGSGVDWDPDDIFVDQAYLTLNPFGDREMAADMEGHVRFGKMPNPFRSKKGVDILIFDSDIMPEGLSLNYGFSPCDCLDVNIDLAYYVINESSGRAADPHFLGSQIDFTFKPMDDVVFGVSPSHYTYRNLDQSFFDRGVYAAGGLGSSYGGNAPGGLSNGNHVQVTDVRAWVEYKGVKPWPMLVFGSYFKNHTAKNTTGFNAGKEDAGWSLGTVMGDKKQNVQMKIAYFVIAANATPANFTDSDQFDGRTNGRGWNFQLVRQIFTNTDFKAELFVSNPLKDDIRGATPGGAQSFYREAIRNHDRLRFRFDVQVKW